MSLPGSEWSVQTVSDCCRLGPPVNGWDMYTQTSPPGRPVMVRDSYEHTPSIAFRHLPPNSARTGYTTISLFPQICPPTKGLGTNKTVKAT